MSAAVPALYAGLFDDAAVFPPGNLPLAKAVPAHVAHDASAHAPVVGAFVLAAKDLDQLASLVAGLDPSSFRLSLTASLAELDTALAAAYAIPAVRLDAVEVALAEHVAPSAVVPAIERALAGRSLPIFVELPRDVRRQEVTSALADAGHMAKLRTGGVRADLYPDEKELAAAVVALTAAGVPLKATAGLHHALRNTDPATGFEQHGFLNLIAATGAALDGADEADVAALLADRDDTRVVDRVRVLGSSVRDAFRSFGTCSLAEPIEDLVGLGLLDAHLMKDL